MVLCLAALVFAGCGNTATKSSAPAAAATTKAAAAATTAAAKTTTAATTQAATTQAATTSAASSQSEVKLSSGAGSCKDKDNKDITIVMCAKHEGISWFDDMRIGIKQFATDTGVNAYQIAPEGGDPAKQLQMVEDLITQGVNAICCVPNDAKSMAPTLQKARDAGIVVIGHEAPDITDSVDYDLAAFTNASHGQRFGENLVKYMNKEGKFASLVGMLTMVPHMEWWQGCVDYVKKNAPDMQCIVDQPYEDKNDNQVAYDKGIEVMKATPDIKGFTDSAASGAGIAQALQERNRNDIALVSTAVPSQAGEYIKAGWMDAGLAWRPADAGYVTCEIALKVLKGEPITTGMDFGKDGYNSVKLEGNEIFGEAPLVFTAENIDQPQFKF